VPPPQVQVLEHYTTTGPYAW